MKRKVVFFINSLYGGGAEKVLQTLLRHISREKFDITVYSVHKEKLTEVYPQDITYRWIYGQSKWLDYFCTFIYNYFSPSVFYRLFVKGTYDTEVAFIEGYATRIVSGSTNLKSKKIAWVHIDLENNHWTRIAYHNDEEEKMCYRHFDVVVSVSETVRQVCQRMFPGCKDYKCLYNPIDSDDIIKKTKSTE